MTVYGWIIVSVLSVAGLFFLTQLVKDILWNHKLKTFHKAQGIHVVAKPVLFWLKRSYGVLLTSMFAITVAFSGTFDQPTMLNDRILVNARSVGNEATLRSLITTNNNGFWDFFLGDRAVEDLAPGMPEPEAAEDNQSPERDFIGTNVQVEGIDEADIMKTDGYTIYYAPRYFNKIRVMEILDSGMIEVQEELDLENLYVDGMYLTDDYLIVIGYKYDYHPYRGIEADVWYEWFYVQYTGTVRVYDRTTLDMVYELETDSNYYEHRLIDGALFLISNKSLYDDDLRPTFTEITPDDETTTKLDYDDIYYFEDVPAQGMTVVTGIKLSDFSVNAQAFLGYVNHIYADADSLYTAYTYYDYSFNTYREYTQIINYDLNSTEATIEYVGQIEIEGRIENSYWMDEHEGYLRVVTTKWNPIQNALYVIEPSETTDQMHVVGSITEGLGKPNETVKSARFNGDFGYVVTFVNMDPLYTIDLSDPNNPEIISYEEEPGYSVYLHVWGADDRLIGFGFDENWNLKISAYITGTGEPVDTYFLNKEDGNFNYSFSEALYNPKAILVDPEKNIFAFPVSKWVHFAEPNEDGWYYSYVSQYLIFSFDFDAENPEDIIGEPIVISHQELEYYTGIERGTYVEFDYGTHTDRIIYTFSYGQMKSYDLSEPFDINDVTYKQVIDFEITE